MKLTPRTKKLLTLSALVLVVIFLSGCRVPMDENNHVIYIANEAVPGSEYTFRTSFAEVFANENWFMALFVYPLSWLINHLAPIISVGGAIAVVTILVNGVLGALTMKSSIATQQMQMIQPEMDGSRENTKAVKTKHRRCAWRRKPRLSTRNTISIL